MALGPKITVGIGVAAAVAVTVLMSVWLLVGMQSVKEADMIKTSQGVYFRHLVTKLRNGECDQVLKELEAIIEARDKHNVPFARSMSDYVWEEKKKR